MVGTVERVVEAVEMVVAAARVVEVKAVAVVGMAERLVPVETAVAGKEEVVEGTWVEAAVAAVRATAARAMAAEMETR